MVVTRSTSFVLLVLAAFVTACSSTGEQQLLQQFFKAAKLRDRTTLANLATVRFEPQTSGVVQEFEITDVGKERKADVAVRALRQAHEDAKAEDLAFTARKKAYQDANIEAIQRVLKAEKDKQPIKRPDVAVQTEWTKWRTEAADHTRRVSMARHKLADQTASLEASVYNPQKPVNISEYDAEVQSKDVTIDAQVRAPQGEVAQKTLVVTLQRVTLKNGKGADVRGRWIVTAVRPAGSPASTSS